MKKTLVILAALMLTLSVLSCENGKIPDGETDVSVSATEEVTETEKETEQPLGTVDEKGRFTDVRLLDPAKTYIGKGKKLLSVDSPDDNFKNPQGGYYDGNTLVQIFKKTADDGSESAIICVFDSEGKLLKQSGELAVDHANNIAFIPEKNAYFVSHCQNNVSEYNKYSLVDADTLEIIKTDTLSNPFPSMGYSPEMKQYGSFEWSGSPINVWDENLNLIKSVEVECPGSLAQGAWCDKKGIWFVRSAQNGVQSEIRWYDWDCALVIAVNLREVGIEPEELSVIGNEVYVTSRNGERTASLYRIVFEEK